MARLKSAGASLPLAPLTRGEAHRQQPWPPVEWHDPEVALPQDMVCPACAEDTQTQGLASQGTRRASCPMLDHLGHREGPYGAVPHHSASGQALQLGGAPTRRWHGPLGSQWISGVGTSPLSSCRLTCSG